MHKWVIEERDGAPEKIPANGNKFLCGNGYLGIRGTLEEHTKEQLVAVNLAGIYDKVGDGWREPLNAPNPLYTYIKIDGTYYRMPDIEPKEHNQWLDYRHGIEGRTTTWVTLRGTVTVESEHFAKYDEPHIVCLSYRIVTDFHADIEVVTGIDGDVWDIHGPHYVKLSGTRTPEQLSMEAETGTGERVAVVSQTQMDFPCEKKEKEEEKRLLERFCMVTNANEPVCLTKLVAIYTTKDTKEPLAEAKKALEAVSQKGYAQCAAEHENVWEEAWKTAEVEIDGDDEAMEALNYSLYHLMSIAPRHTGGLSIGARGLSGQTYKGAVFWDTEMFMLDFFLYTNPSVAKTLLEYRIDTLGGAKQKAKSYGYEGAFYAWESQEGGFDACSDYNVTDVFTGRDMRTYFKDKQIHISAAVVYGLMRYTKVTGDTSLLAAGGAKTIVECASFYYSLLVKRVAGDYYELRDVIGPDEYHERVNNNGYTNRMAKFTLETAAELLGDDGYADLEEYRKKGLGEAFKEAAEKLYLPEPDANGVLEQFDGYFSLEDVSVAEVRSRLLNEKEYWGGAYGVASQTQVIKQADTVTWLVMFPEDYPVDICKKNWEYYEPRTEHGSSLSACMYALLACRCGNWEQAYPLFLKSAEADIKGGGKEWAGLVYIGGTHPAAAGGAYMTAVNGFGGVRIENGQLHITPQLPAHWNRLRFMIQVNGSLCEVIEKREKDNQITVQVKTLAD